jgi:hypothetical protein
MKVFRKYALLALVAWAGLFQAGCFGKFALTRKLYSWNESVGSKFVQSLVMWVMFIIPVYQLVGFIDIVILNLIEFWSGSNPISMKAGEMERQLVVKDGETFEITATQNRFDIVQITGEKAGRAVALRFDAKSSNWIYEGDGKSLSLFNMTQDENGQLLATAQLPDGSTKVLGNEMFLARK